MTKYNVRHGLAGLTQLYSYEMHLTAGRELHPAPKVFFEYYGTSYQHPQGVLVI